MAQERDYSEQITKRLIKIESSIRRAENISRTVNDFLPRKRAARFPHGSSAYWDEIMKAGAQDGPVAKVKVAIEQKAKPTLIAQRQRIEEFRDLENRLPFLRSVHESGGLDKSILAEAEAQSANLRNKLGFDIEKPSEKVEHGKKQFKTEALVSVNKEQQIKKVEKYLQQISHPDAHMPTGELEYAQTVLASLRGEPEKEKSAHKLIIDEQLRTANIDGRLIKFSEKSTIFEILVFFARSVQKEASTAQLDELSARNHLSSPVGLIVYNLRVKIETDPSNPQILKRIEKNRDGSIYRLDAEVEFVGEQKKAKKDGQKLKGKAQKPESSESAVKEEQEETGPISLSPEGRDKKELKARLLQPQGEDFFGGRARRIEYQPRPEDIRTKEETIVLNAIFSRVLPIARRDIYWDRLQEHLMINIPKEGKYSASELYEIFAQALEKMIEEASDERARLRWSEEDQVLGKKIELELNNIDKRKLKRIIQRRLRSAENHYRQDYPQGRWLRQ